MSQNGSYDRNSSSPNSPADKLTLQEAALRLRLSERTLRRWVKEGRLPAHQLPGANGRYLLDAAAVDGVLREVRG